MQEAQPKMFVDHARSTYEGLPAPMAIAMAMMEVTGVRSLIDARCDFDRLRRILTPGMAVKALIAPIFILRTKDPLYLVEKTFASCPTDRVFRVVCPGDLNDDALGRALDTLASMDLTELYHECCDLCMRHYGFVSYVLHGDATNFSVRCIFKEDPGDGTAVPRHSCHAKDLHNELKQYGLYVVTDSDGIPRYMRPYSGNVSDIAMTRDALEFIKARYSDDLDKIVYIGDSKMMCEETMDLIERMGIGFVSRCPEDFGDNLQDRAIRAAESAGFAEDGEIRYFDTRLDAIYQKGKRGERRQKLRCIIYRDMTAVRAKIHGMKDKLTEVKECFSGVEKNGARSREAALRYFDSVKAKVDREYGFAKITPEIRRMDETDAEGDVRRTVWKVEAIVELDEDEAMDIAIREATSVIVTNLPRSKANQANPRRGMTAMGVKRLYADEYKVEHTFRQLKSGMGLDAVFLQNPARENAMMFVLNIADLMMSIADAVFKRSGASLHGKDLTMYRLSRELQGTMITYSRDSNRLGVLYPVDCDLDVFEYTDLLGINPQYLLGCRSD